MTRALDRGRARLLYAEARLLMIVRWVFGATIAVLGVVGLIVGAEDAWRFAAVGAVALAGNAALAISGVVRPALALRYNALARLAAAQILFDILCLCALVAWTGGLRSPALFLFLPLVLFIAGLIRSEWQTLGLCTIGVGIVAGWCALTGTGPVTRDDWVVALTWAATVIGTALLAIRITNALHEREAARIRQIARIRQMAAQLQSHQAGLMHGEKLVAMGQLAAGIAHEITNPLASMDSVLQLMQRHPDHPRPDAVNTLREQVQRILRIVRQLTSYAHPSRGITDTVSIDEVVRSAVDLLGFSKRSVEVHVESRIPEGQATVRLNPQAIQQVITNLLVNAMDAVADTGVPRIDVRTSRDEQSCVIEVSDNGTGIADENMPRIFEPFFTTKPVGQGTGLGLSICSRLIEEQQGSITVESTPGRGTTFRVRVPAMPMDHPATPVRPVELAGAPQVEDARSIRR